VRVVSEPKTFAEALDAAQSGEEFGQVIMSVMAKLAALEAEVD